MPAGSRTRGGLTDEWHIEQELLARLIEVQVNTGQKRWKDRIKRPGPDQVESGRTKAAAVDRMVAMAKRLGGGV